MKSNGNSELSRSNASTVGCGAGDPFVGHVFSPSSKTKVSSESGDDGTNSGSGAAERLVWTPGSSLTDFIG